MNRLRSYALVGVASAVALILFLTYLPYLRYFVLKKRSLPLSLQEKVDNNARLLSYGWHDVQVYNEKYVEATHDFHGKPVTFTVSSKVHSDDHVGVKASYFSPSLGQQSGASFEFSSEGYLLNEGPPCPDPELMPWLKERAAEAASLVVD
jgi:hypothetical protein